MPRISILDSILNRPSQSYTAPDVGKEGKGSSSKWSAPSDLPNGRQQGSSSILSGNMFRKKSSRNLGGMGSDAGMSQSGSTIGRSTSQSRFGRKKRDPIMPGHFDFDHVDGRSQYASSSVADSNATASKGKRRWWETGSMGFGRRSRASSIAGDSIFSEPERGAVPDWSGLAGIGSGANRGRSSRSDVGRSPSRPSLVPPMPRLDSRIHSAAPVGRLQSNVAPLGASTVNPTLNQRQPRPRMASASNSNLKKAAVPNSRASSPPPPRMASPPPRMASPPPRMSSPPLSDSGHSSSHKQRDSMDWKDFVKSMSGSDISKAWEGSRGDESNVRAPQKPGQGVDRRRSNVVRLQRELQQEAQFEQVIRDPGIIHQDLLSRAASQVVGSPPAGTEGKIDFMSSNIRPGSIVGSPNAERSRSPPPPERSLSPPPSKASPSQALPALPSAHTPVIVVQNEESSDDSSGEEESDEGTDSSDESEESGSRQQHLAAVDEEDEESSSVGHEMRPHHVVGSATAGGAALTASKYRAFETALNRGQSSIGHGSPKEPQPTSASSPVISEDNPSRSSSAPTSPIKPPRLTSLPLGTDQDNGEGTPVQASEISNLLPAIDDRANVEADEMKETMADTEQDGDSKDDDDDAQSIQSVQTGRNTVKFDQGAKGERADNDRQSVDSVGTASKPRSANSSLRSASRPPTLSRRLSDVSLGTTFGMSGFLNGQSRTSSRRLKMSDGDSDSERSQSDEEADAELKAKIKTEQERLRGMKMGEDFFGGSLSSILDKFGKGSWDGELAKTVDQLGLDVGPSSRGAKRESDTLSTQEILTMNAQERINEVRRLRLDGPPAGSGEARRDNSDAATVQSTIAPSFAALWLMNEKQKPMQSTDEPPPAVKSSHARQLSNASSDGGHSSSHGSASARFRNFFSSSTNAEGGEKKKTSVMDRPRNRAPKPKEMAGLSISQGKLKADDTTPDEDVRSTFPALLSSQTLSQMQQAQAKTVDQSLASSPPTSPITPAAEVVQPSKSKPAPVKSALKAKPSKSLADTLFFFALPSSPEKKKKAEKGKSSDETLRLTGPPPSVWAQKEKKVTKAEKKAGKGAATEGSTGKGAATVERAAKGVVAVAEEQGDKEQIRGGQQTPPRQDFIPPSQSIYYTPPKPTGTTVSSQESTPEKPGFEVEQFASALDLATAHDGEGMLTRLQIPGDHAEGSEDEWKTPLEDPRVVEAGKEAATRPSKGEGTPSSELWSGESAVSTGPTTPGASDILDRSVLTDATKRDSSLRPDLADKKLPMPPAPTFPDGGVVSDSEATPLALPRTDPIHLDHNKTPLAEVKEPSFGMNLIPPTPPALESRDSYTNLSSKPPKGGAKDTLREQDYEEEEAAPLPPSPMQRSNSKSKSSPRKADADVAKRESKKKGSSSSASVGSEFQGQGMSLPHGLVATTVTSTASKRQSTDGSTRPSTGNSEPSTDGTIQRKKSKGKRPSGKPSRTYADPQPSDQADTLDRNNSRRSSSALSMSVAGAPPVPDLPSVLSSLAIPSSQSETNSSAGSDSLRPSRSASASPSPAPSASGRSAISSSNASWSASSDLSTGRPYSRKIRTLSAGPNGQAQTSLMSSISEWESSPNGQRDGSISPMASYIDSPVPASLVTRSQSSINTGSSPYLVRHAPIGASTNAYLGPTAPQSNRSGSLDGHGLRRFSATSELEAESEQSGVTGTQSVMSLPVVPQSTYRPQDPFKASNTIDDRLYAKTTMATVSVTSGAFRSKSLRNRKSTLDVSRPGGDDGRRGSRTSIDTVPDGLVEELHRTTMSLTAHTPPPRKLSSTQVLVQVIACAIDETDRLLLKEKIRSESGYGFVPGRSFSGRVMETGWEVKRMRKGDMIFGLQSSRKCGALAEFMTIDQNLLAKAPENCLTTEQIAALPSVGVLAYQMMINHCSQLKRGSRVLILNAHDGVGLLTMQESANLGLIIVAHCPDSVSDGLALCEANGAHEVVIGDALWALNSLHESSFDLVLDTVGGRRIYDAARRILAFEGQFCTCIGDMQSSANPNLKSHLRSLRRSFFKKDTKQIGYEWIGSDTGEDCREALEAVKLAAERGQICPRLQSILSFGDAPRAFETSLRGGETEPGSVVVRIS